MNAIFLRNYFSKYFSSDLDIMIFNALPIYALTILGAYFWIAVNCLKWWRLYALIIEGNFFLLFPWINW